MHSTGYRDQCHCGIQYYDSHGGWDWSDGELEALHKRALGIIGFIETHASIIACYLESERKASIAALEERLERLESWSIKDPESVQIELLSSEKLREIDLE